jgi:hypothetical protein
MAEMTIGPMKPPLPQPYDAPKVRPRIRQRMADRILRRCQFRCTSRINHKYTPESPDEVESLPFAWSSWFRHVVREVEQLER